MNEIYAKDIFSLGDLKKYKLHLACENEDQCRPLDEFVNDRQKWLGWNEYRGTKDDWTRPYIFSLIEFYPKAHTHLFGGVFKVIEKHADRYVLEEVEEYKKFVGRVKISFHHRTKRPRGRAFYLETLFEKFIVSEISEKVYNG